MNLPRFTRQGFAENIQRIDEGIAIPLDGIATAYSSLLDTLVTIAEAFPEDGNVSTAHLNLSAEYLVGLAASISQTSGLWAEFERMNGEVVIFLMNNALSLRAQASQQAVVLDKN